jgi:predicted transglutaminase-like cysteine proteinase
LRGETEPSLRVAASVATASAALATVISLALATGSGAAWAQARREPGFSGAATERLIQAYEKRFGQPARGRIDAWKRFALERTGGATQERALIEAVNGLLNRLRFVDDQAHWGEVDYWATPAESIGSGGADCEDYAIAKYYLLRELGVPTLRLRLVYVRAVRLDQAHMVLAYYPRPEAEPLVLDNLEQTVRQASERPDLVPVYSFNDEAIWVETRGRIGSPQQIRNWSLLLERLRRELDLAGLGRGTS